MMITVQLSSELTEGYPSGVDKTSQDRQTDTDIIGFTGMTRLWTWSVLLDIYDKPLLQPVPS